MRACFRILMGATALLAASNASSAPGTTFSTSVMGFANATEQGGKGAKGSTVLTETQLQYQGNRWGLGAFFLFDMQGEAEKDLAAGPKAEVNFDPFFLEAGYALLMQRSFTDRTIAKQTGSGWQMGVGTRFRLGTGAGGRGGGAGGTAPYGLFLQFSYKYRVQKVTKQDAVSLSEPIVQTDAYPLFGIGYQF